MPEWWGKRRYGLFVRANLATVPAWAPIGHYAGWYQSQLGDDLRIESLQNKPLVEVLAHHRDRWGHIENFDDFLPLLTFHRFDAESWARLAVDAGMSYTVFAAKHHDGWCWWDAPDTQRTMTRGGPTRNVLAEYAAACERNDITFGTYYSLLDWADDRYSSEDYVRDVLHPHVLDLVTRYGSSMLWADGGAELPSSYWRAAELLDRIWEVDPDVVVNDRWGAPPSETRGAAAAVRTFEYDVPDDIVTEPWELCRGIGASFSHNRAERAEHLLSGFDIVSLLTEVVAKGGHLLLGVGPSADGSIPALQEQPLRDAGEWVRKHDSIVNKSRPWTTWGDAHVRYFMVDEALHAVDLSGRGHFAALGTDQYTISKVAAQFGEHVGGTGRTVGDDGRVVRFHQDADGLHLDLPRSSLDRPSHQRQPADITTYRIELTEAEQAVGLFEPSAPEPIPLAPLLAEVSPGDVVQLGEGIYCGPVVVPPGVALRGLGPRRTTIDGGGATTVLLQRNARVEHLRLLGGPARDRSSSVATVRLEGRSATVLGCEVVGHLIVDADDILIRATTATGVIATNVNRLTVSRCQLVGSHWDIGVEIDGGDDHEIDSCEIHDHLCAVRMCNSSGTVIRGTNISARWWGIHLEHTERAHVHGNNIDHTMRAIDVDGGTQALIDGNAVADGDSGCVVESGASGCQISGNRWERCRIGILAWGVTGLHVQDNDSTDLHEPEHEVVFGP